LLLFLNYGLPDFGLLDFGLFDRVRSEWFHGNFLTHGGVIYFRAAGFEG